MEEMGKEDTQIPGPGRGLLASRAAKDSWKPLDNCHVEGPSLLWPQDAHSRFASS